MLRATTLILALSFFGTATLADTQAQSCDYQAQVVVAVQQARLNGVRQSKVESKVTEAATWPAKYNQVIALVTPWVYDQKKRDLREADLGGMWKQGCMAQQ